MSRPGLLRRAAAATLGASVQATQTTSLTASFELGLARRAAAAVIGIRFYRLVDNPRSASMAWEVRRTAGAASCQFLLKAPPPKPEADAAAGSPSPHRTDGLRPDPLDWITFAHDLTAPVVLGSSSTRAEQRRHGPRRALVLAAVAAVLAIAFTAFGYQLRPFIQQRFPAHSVQGDDPSPSPTPATNNPSPSPTPAINDPVLSGRSVSVAPRSDSADCSKPIVFTFSAAAQRPGTIDYTWHPDNQLIARGVQDKTGSMTFTATNEQHDEYSIQLTGTQPGDHIQGGMSVKVTSPQADAGVNGDQFDITCT